MSKSNKDIPISFPKSLKRGTFTDKGDKNFAVIALSGEYEGYEFVWPNEWLHISDFDKNKLYTYIQPNYKININKRVKNETTGDWKTVDTKELTPQELSELFKRSSE